MTDVGSDPLCYEECGFQKEGEAFDQVYKEFAASVQFIAHMS